MVDGLQGIGDRAGAPRVRGLGRVWDRSVRTKLLLLISVMALVSGGICVAAARGMGQMQARSEYLYEQNLLPLADLGELKASALGMRAAVLNAAISQGGQDSQKYVDLARAQDAVFDKALTAYTATDMTGREDAVRRLQEGIALYRQVRDDKMVPAAVAGDYRGFRRVRDAEGIPAYERVDDAIEDLVHIETEWAHATSLASQTTYRRSLAAVLIFLVVGLLVGVGFGMLISRRLTRSVGRISHVVEGLADGDLTRSAGVEDRDEIGRMAHGLDRALGRLREVVTTVAAGSQQLAGAAEELSSVSRNVIAAAEDASARAGAVSAAAEQVSGNVHTVAAGTEQMGTSIQEIAGSASQAAQVATEAVCVTEAVTDTVARLNGSSVEIGNVVKVITSIAEQTNLLALNATIEAARAGEAGKGFAVVASEVKDLAQETARATGDIGSRIEAIQQETSRATESIDQIVQVIQQIHGYTTTIASAVEEQTATTSDISRNISEAAGGSTQIAAGITDVATATHSTTSSITEVHHAASNLTQLSSDLQRAAGYFTL
jgi:methyl-accepting chemotaxis protein